MIRLTEWTPRIAEKFLAIEKNSYSGHHFRDFYLNELIIAIGYISWKVFDWKEFGIYLKVPIIIA